MHRLVEFWTLFVATWVCTASVGQADDATKPFGLKTRTPWTTSRVVGTPDPPPPYTVQRAYPQLTFKNPVFIAQEPGTDRIFVAVVSLGLSGLLVDALFRQTARLLAGKYLPSGRL